MTDQGFIRRVYRTSAALWAFGLIVTLSVSGVHAAAGWTAGSAVSFGVLWSLEWIVRRCLVPGKHGAKRTFARFYLLKLLAVVLVLWLVVRAADGRFALIAAFCAGVVLTQTVIVLKAVGQILSQRLSG